MIISINQPAYIPWLGYYERIVNSDLHIVLNHVQFEKNSFINRNKILTKHGSTWLTIPSTRSNNEKRIHEYTTINNKKWINAHLKTLNQNYLKTKYFKKYFEEIQKILTNSINEENLFQIINNMNLFLLKELDINTKIEYSNELSIESKKSELILDICNHFKSKTYLSGINGKEYLELDDFNKNGIEVLFQNYKHPEYYQSTNKFHPYLSVLDLLFNEGKNSLQIIKQGSLYIK